MKKPLLLVGSGYHCRSCIDIIEQGNNYEIAGIVASYDDHITGSVFGYPIIGTDGDLEELRNYYVNAFVALDRISKSATPITIYNRLNDLSFELPSIISPLAYISPHANVGCGTIIMPHTVVNVGAKIGDNCIINSKVIIEQDVKIGDHCYVGSGSTILQGAKLEEGCFLDINMTVKESRTVEPNFVVSARNKSLFPSSTVDVIQIPIKMAIFGASGFSRETADVALMDQIDNLVFIDNAKNADASVISFEIISEEYVDNLKNEGFLFAIGIGNNKIRKKVFNRFKNLRYPNLVHPSASMGNLQIEKLENVQGNIISAGVRFTNNIKFGDFGIYNLNSTIGHDCNIENFINISPGVNVSGNVLVQEGAYIGTGASILPGKSLEDKLIVGNFSTIGGSALVNRAVGPNDVVVGVPAKSIKI